MLRLWMAFALIAVSSLGSGMVSPASRAAPQAEPFFAWCYWNSLSDPQAHFFSAAFSGPKFGESSQPYVPSGMRARTGRNDWAIRPLHCSAHSTAAEAIKYRAATMANVRRLGIIVFASDYAPRGYVALADGGSEPPRP